MVRVRVMDKVTLGLGLGLALGRVCAVGNN